MLRGHRAHAEAFVAAAFGDALPGAQGVHADEPASAQEPGKHDLHDASATAPRTAEARPAGHFVQEVAPAGAYSPRAQQTAAPGALKSPSSHGVHASSLVAAATADDVFALHGVQLVEPGAAQLPSGQHTPAPAGDESPLPHGAHWFVELPFAALKLIAEHATQARSDVAPATVLYEPEGHGVQPPATEAPASDEKVPAKHFRHEASDDCPSSGCTVPGGHAMQASDDAAPGVALHVPAGQARHVLSMSPGGDHVPSAQQIELPAPLASPAVQFLHVAFEVAPKPADDVLAAQAMHIVEPSGAKNPRAQHVASPRPLLNVLLAQGAQSVDTAPGTAVYEPAAHGAHFGAPSATNAPSAQHVAAPGDEKLPAGQLAHAAAARRPAEGEKVLAPQGSHLRGACAYVPAGHVVFR